MLDDQRLVAQLALLAAVEHLEAKGADWLDIQVMTEHMKKFGAVEIPRMEFLERLEKTQQKSLSLF